MKKTIEQRFWEKVDVRCDDECWPWTRARYRNGYGAFSVGGRHTTAHRVALVLSGGHIETGQVARHTCDNPPCCNPRHVVAGTQVQNMADCIERDRLRPGGGKQKGRCGERSNASRITEEVAKRVIELKAEGISLSNIEKMTGVRKGNASVIGRLTWLHLVGMSNWESGVHSCDHEWSEKETRCGGWKYQCRKCGGKRRE